MSKRSQAYKFALDLIFPELCQGCLAEGSYLCSACATKITIPIQRCSVCSKNSLMGITHPECRKAGTLDGLLVAADYEIRSVRNLIWNFKYNSVENIGSTLATLLADFLVGSSLEDFFENSVVVPVPLHARRERMRGFNQAAVLGKNFSARTGFPYLDVLKRIRNTTRQVDLEKNQRIENLRGAFELGRTDFSITDRRIILIDDVATTGATLNECAKVLRQLHPGSIWGLVVARN